MRFENVCLKSGVYHPLQTGDPKHLFSTTSQHNGKFNGLYTFRIKHDIDNWASAFETSIGLLHRLKTSVTNNLQLRTTNKHTSDERMRHFQTARRVWSSVSSQQSLYSSQPRHVVFHTPPNSIIAANSASPLKIFLGQSIMTHRRALFIRLGSQTADNDSSKVCATDQRNALNIQGRNEEAD